MEIQSGTLGHLWKIRKFLGNSAPEDLRKIPSDLLDMLAKIAGHSFEVAREIDPSSLDKSLRVLSSICVNGCRTLVSCEDPGVTFYSRHFNRMINSGRSLFRCYDCGTVARAMFLGLIAAHRKDSDMTRSELERMKKWYRPRAFPVRESLRMFRKHLLDTPVGTVFICSVSLSDHAGHVWVMEKFSKENGSAAVRMFQTCLNNFLLIDQMVDEGYLTNKDQCIDHERFLEDLERLIIPHDWDDEDHRLFCKWFRYRCRTDMSSRSSSNLCFTYVTY